MPIKAVPISVDDILTAYRDYEQKAFVESLLQKKRSLSRSYTNIIRLQKHRSSTETPFVESLLQGGYATLCYCRSPC